MGVWACAKSEENKKACGNLTHFPVGCSVDRSVRNSGVRNSEVLLYIYLFICVSRHYG